MANALTLVEGVIRPSLTAELDSFRATNQRVSSYYLNLRPPPDANGEAARIALKNALACDRERIDQLEDARPAVRHALHRDWELVEHLAPTLIGERSTFGLACFVASDSGYGRAIRLAMPVRNRAFFEDRFVLWPLRQILDQSDRYELILTDKDDARLFLFFQEQIEEVADILDEAPGRVRFPDLIHEPHLMRKHVEWFHHHFQHTADVALRLYEREPFERVIIGGRRETLPQFESHLHRYLRDRIAARWEIDVRTPMPEIRERALTEEQQILQRRAHEVWNNIQELLPKRGAVGPEETFKALWQRRVETLLEAPGVSRKGYRCSACGRLSLSAGTCIECGGNRIEIPNVFEEAVHDAIDQSAMVLFWKDPILKGVDSLAALKRF